MANFHRPNSEGSFEMNSSEIRKGEERSKYSALLEAWSSFGDAKAQLDGLEKRVDGAVLLSQNRNSAPHLPTSSKPRSSHEVRCKDHRGSSPQRGLRVVKHRQSSRQKRVRHKEKENGKKARRVEAETDKARKEESTVIVEGCVLNSDSQLNETFTVTPELPRALPQEHADTERGGTQEGSVEAGVDAHGPSRRMVFEQAKELAETQTSPRRAMQTAVSPLSLQRTNKSAVFGPPISSKGDAEGSDVPGQGRQEGHHDRQQDRKDERKVQQHAVPVHFPNRMGLGPRGVLREFAMPSVAALDSLQEEAARQQHAVRETAAVVQNLLRQPPLQPRSVSTWRGESHPFDTAVSTSKLYKGTRQDASSVVRKVCLSPEKSAAQGRYSDTAPPAVFEEGQVTGHTLQRDPFVMYSRHFAHNPSLHSNMDLPVQPQHREELHASVLDSGKSFLGAEHWKDPFTQDPAGRKRKVASVPPPQPPVGMAVGRRGKEETVRAAPSSSQGHGAPARSEERQSSPKAPSQRSTALKAAVRKVAKQKHPQHSKRGPEKTITPFSWRAGKELSDRVLSVLNRIEPAKEPDRSPRSLQSSAASQPSTSQSGVGSSAHLIPHHQPSPSQHSAEVNAVKLLADMDQEPSEDEAARKGEEPKRQQGKSERGGRRKVSGPPKRPKYNFEPVYIIPKTRHYCSADVQQYMQRKKEERKKAGDEHKRAAQRQKQLTEQRLQELSQARKQRLNVNLAKVYSSQTRPEMAFLKQVAAGLSKPTPESMETPSCSDMEELAMEQSQPRPLAQHPPYERERAQPASGLSFTKRSDFPPLSPSSSQSDTCSHEDTPTGSELEEVPLLVDDERPKRREGAEAGDLPPMPRASTMTMSGLGAVGHPLGLIVQPHSLLGAKGSHAKQDRLRALTISALTLKAKVEMERKRILEASRMGIIPVWRAQETPVHVSTRSGTSPAGVSPSSSPRRSIGTNTEQQLTEYPGVGNLDAHVLAMWRERKERSAATNIQAAFRGYVVRKALRGTGRWPKSGAEQVEDEGAKLNTGGCGRSAGLSEAFAASEELSHELGSTTTIPPSSLGTGDGEGLQPWEQRGGDVHSLVHIIAKQETRRRRKAAERASSVHQVGAAGEDVGVQVNIVEVNTADTDWSGSRRGDRVRREDDTAPVQEGSGSVAGHGKPHTSTSTPVKGDAVSPGQLRSPTAMPRAQQVSLTATPPAQPVSLTATPPTQPVSSTATPPAQPVSSTATPPAQPVSSTATPPVQPVSSTATPPAQPVSSTATPPAQPVILTATPLAQPDSPTSTPSASVVSMEPDSLAEEGTSTPEASHMYHVQGRAGENGEEETGRLSPRSLQLKLSAELMLLETAQDQMQHLGDVERARYVALAQRETLSVAQVLKSAHEEEIRSLSAKTELELEAVRQQLQLARGEASTAVVRVEGLERQAQGEMDRNAQLMAKLEREAHESQLQLAEARKAASVAVIAAARKQLEGAHELATQTAIGAAKAAVEAALAGQRETERHTSSEVESCSESTPSLDEWGSKHGTRSNTETESISASDSQTPTEYSSGKERAVEAASEDDVPEDLDSTLVTEVVEEEEEKSKSTTSSTVQERTVATNSHAVSPVKSQTTASLSVVTPLSHGGAVLDARQEPDEVSFRMVLPSEGHRRRQMQDRRPLSPRLSLSSSISSDMASPSPSPSPSASSVLLPDEAGVPKELSHASVLSGGEESFDDFTLRMIRQYVKDQDARARHQMTLLKLKERALEEQTKAKLTVLDQWKRRLKKKGGDDHMPAVLKKEKGLMKNYKSAKAEIHNLWLVQHQEKEERQRLLLQEREIGNLRLSAQSYWQKARLLEENEGRNVSVSVSSVSPVSCVSGRLESPLQVKPSFPPSTSTPFEKTKSPASEQTSISEEVPEEEEGEGEGDVVEVFEKTDVTESRAEQTSVLRTVSSAPSTSHAEGSGEVDRTGKSVTEEPSCRLSGGGEPLGSKRSEGEEGPPPAGSQDRDREITRSTTTPSTIEEYPLVHRLAKTDYTTTERRLAKREEQLQRQQKMAEGAVAAQQRLLEKEKQLRQKEEQISLLLDRAEALRTQRLELSTKTTGGSQWKSDSICDRSSEIGRSPQKSDSVRMRDRRDSVEEQEAPSGEGKVSEEVVSPSLLTTTSIAEVLSARPAQGAESVAGEVSEDIKSGPSKGFGEYSHDTFESITTAAGVLTSTPYSGRRDQQQATRDDVSSPRQISESPTDVMTTISSVTTATESSEIEQRIRQLKEDLSQRKEEVRRVQQEQKRRKRGLLQEKEEQLKKKLKALEQKLQGAKQSLSHVVPSNVSVHSTTATESEGEREQQTSLRRQRQRHHAHTGGDTTARLPRSVEPSLSYTPFTDDQAVDERFSPVKASRSDNQSTLVIGEDITLTSPQMQDESIKTAEVEDESVKTAGVEDETVKTAEVEDESIQTAGVENESVKTAGVEDESVKSAGVEDESIQTAEVEDESVTLTISHKAKSALLVEEKPLSVRRIGAIPSVSSVKSPPLSSAHSAEGDLHSSTLSSPRRSTKSLAGHASGKLSPGGSPSRIPIPSRLALSPQSSSPATSLKSLQSKHSPTSPRKGTASETLNDQEEKTLRDAHSYSESFTAVSESHREQEGTTNIVKTALAPSAEEETTTEGEEEEEEVLTEVEEQLMMSSGASEAELTGSPPSLAEEGGGALAPSALQQDQVASGTTAAMGVEGGVPVVETSRAVDVFNQLVERLCVGQRVLVGGAVAGVVRFVGGVHFTSGTFIGVELDEGKGKNDGSFDGVRYFDCPEGHGLFAPPNIVSLLQEEKDDTAGDAAHESPEEEEADHLFEHERTGPEAVHYPTAVPGETEDVRSPSTESPTPSEVSSLDMEEVVPSDLEEEEEERETETEKQRKEKTLASLKKLNTVNGVANGLMQQLMKELMVDVSAAAQKKRTLADREKQRRAMADSITNDLLAAFLQSEVHLMCNIRNAKKAALEEETAHEEPLAEVPAKPSHLPLAARGVLPLTHLSAAPSHKLSPEPLSLSPPPSPPGSPPRYSARAFAGDRSPPPTLPPDTSHPHVGVAQAERPMSPVSISSLMEEHPFSDIELTILPRDKASVDKITETAWNDYLNATQEQKDAGTPFKTPKSVLAVRSLSSQPSHLITDEEQACRDSFGHLVYQLAVAVIRELQPARGDQYFFRQSISWKMKRERRKSLVDAPLTLDNVKQIVFARLVEGRLPIRLPKGRYHHGMRRPGGKEVDFLEAVLIKELRADERRWTDFEGEERDIKLKTADRILDLLLDEVVQEVKATGHKKSHIASH